MSLIVCHAGSASTPSHVDGPKLSCTEGLAVLAKGEGALQAVVSATRLLEDDERFNAGTGSNLRFDGQSIQMDASCMVSSGRFGAVASIERVKNPIDVAQRVLAMPHILLAGDGATAFARQCGLADFDPMTESARERWRALVSITGSLGDWSLAELEEAWNFELPLREALGGDTVGSVAWDGEGFAGALSSGGTTTVLRGRVGDVPLPGCGLFVGASGAIAATGDGEHIAEALLAYRAYGKLEQGLSPDEVVDWALNYLDDSVDVGIIVLNRNGFAGGARHGMAWCGQSAKAQSQS